MKRQAVIFWIAIVLAAIGLLGNILFGGAGSLMNLLVPLIVFGVVFLLYKFPPARYNKRPKVKPSQRTMEKYNASKRGQSSAKRKNYPFQVIEGSKGKNDDQQPKYH
ncbi:MULTISPECIES: hypothetical protein [Paenibacillus]|jgi:hypothetical protein|uniref:DUF2207 domain-containing protein n=3 Tax=Paenibacillus TaxID=44249 RepID=A0A1R1EV00_9BACL|nr:MULTISPECIES: hypothetical protein [Paenibacillus]MBJ9988378.1 hypothetical protein [Paenibacillus sp. S28]MCM2999456.1 hypothetical protein [Paenibacillus cellulositrophicus]MEC0176366.1 hypothetical protein [Paenibacillus favisporus]OMF55608.1 hypothetical protein BK138_13170 [Paenibacillus rhizosphaerae]OXL84754.1 hypothetical protein BCV73_17815 [Paenibacillus sp. SSG-1]